MGKKLSSITEIQWVYLFISLFCIFPTILLLRYFKMTHVWDYLIFAGVFISISINQFFSNIIIDNPTNIIVNQIVTSSYILVYLFIYLHVIRLQSEKPSRKVWLLGVVPYVILQMMILFYQRVDLPQNTNFLYFTMHNVDSYQNGVAFTFKGNVLMGQGYDYLISIYRIFILIYAILIYFRVKTASRDTRLKTVRYLWIIIGTFTMGRPLMYLLDLFTKIDFDPFTRISFDIFAIVLIPFIIIKYPEYVLISNSQLIRASYLYSQVRARSISQHSTNQETFYHDPELIYEYIRSLQPDLMKNIKRVPKKIIHTAKKLI